MIVGSWDPVWEEIFSTRPWGRYPPEELVRFVSRNYGAAPDRRLVRILDLGCGPGACTWYLAREGFSACGIDASPTAVRMANERVEKEGLHAEFHIGDMTKLPWAGKYFDAAIDIESISANTAPVSRQILAEAFRVLKPGGRLFSISFKSGSWGDGTGRQVEEHVFEDIPEGPCAGMGRIRFSPERQIRELYSHFGELTLEYTIRSMDQMEHSVAQWVITCRKPSGA